MQLKEPNRDRQRIPLTDLEGIGGNYKVHVVKDLDEGGQDGA